MLNFFKKEPTADLVQFYPELALYRINDEADGTPLIHIRFASGDENNLHKNIRINANSIQSISLETLDLNKPDKIHQSNFLNFESVIRVVRFDGTEQDHSLGNHKIEVSHGPNKDISMIAARAEANDILQEAFSEALSDYLDIGNTPKSTKTEKNSTKKPKSFFGSLLNFALIAVVSYTIIVVGYNLFKGSSETHSIQNTALETLSPEAINKQVEATPNDEVLQEFGLEPGVNLDQ